MRSSNVRALARKVASGIERLPERVEALCHTPKPTARSWDYGMYHLTEPIERDAAEIAPWIKKYRHPREAERFRQNVESLCKCAWACLLSQKPVDPPLVRVQPLSALLRNLGAEVEWVSHFLRVLGKGSIDREEANRRAREALKGRPPKGKRWSLRTLADAIGCSTTLVHGLPAWRTYADEHGLTRKEAAAPKAVSLTPAVLANEGRDDAELQRLIAEQHDEDEGSPLDPAPSKRRRRRRKV